MQGENLEKRLEEIEMKIEELEDMILDNKLKIMDIFSKMEGNKTPVIKSQREEHIPAPPKKSIIKSIMPKKEGNVDDLKERARKIKSMLREMK